MNQWIPIVQEKFPKMFEGKLVCAVLTPPFPIVYDCVQEKRRCPT